MLNETNKRIFEKSLTESVKLSSKHLKNSEKLIMSLVEERTPKRIIEDVKLETENLELAIKQIENIIERSNIKTAAYLIQRHEVQALVQNFNIAISSTNATISYLQAFLSLGILINPNLRTIIQRNINRLTYLLKYTQDIVLNSNVFDLTKAKENKILNEVIAVRKIIKGKMIKSLWDNREQLTKLKRS